MEEKMDKKPKIIIKTQVLELMQESGWKGFIDSVIEEGPNAVNTKIINGYTLLSCAAEYGDKEIVEYLIQNGAKGNVKNFDGSKPLHIAAKHGHMNLVEFFINLSICVDSRDDLNCTPLHYVTDQFYACEEHLTEFISGYDKDYATMFWICSDHEENVELVSLLLNHGADIDAEDSYGNNPLLYAVIHTNKEVVEMLVRRGAYVNCRDQDKWTVLHFASYFGWLNVVQCLVERKVDLNEETLRGDTPLLLAAKRSHREVVELLIKSGAKVSSRGMLKTTALHYAAQEGWLNIVQLLVEYKVDINARTCSGATSLMLSVKHEHSDIFDYLVKCGADLVGSECKTTILHYACKAGWVELVQSLVDGGSDIDAQTRQGDTPLLIAAFHSDKEIVDILLKSGATLHTCNSNSYSLLHYACKNGWIDIVQRFVDEGLDINTKNLVGKTPLMFSAFHDNIEIFNCLLEAGADFEIRTSKGRTVLHDAVRSGSLEIVSTLQRKGADVNDKTVLGYTPLYLAVRYRHLDIVRHLLDAGADPNVKLSDGLTPLYLAVGRDDTEIAACLLKSGADCNEDIGFETPFERYVAREDDYEFNDLDLFIENGAYITSETYSILMKNMLYFKKEILEDVGVCKQLILNKFNNLDLPKIYQVPFAVKCLPAIKGMKIGAKRYAAQCIEESVIRDIDTKGFCNITVIQPIVLSLLSAKAFIKYFIDYRHYYYMK